MLLAPLWTRHMNSKPGLSKLSLKTGFGVFETFLFRSQKGECCLVFKAPVVDPISTIRIHSACLFGESFFSEECDCRQQLTSALNEIANRGGVLVYLFQEGRGIGLQDKIRAMALEHNDGMSTVDAFAHLGYGPDPRNYDIAIEALRAVGVSEHLRVITNNPRKLAALTANGFRVAERVEPQLRLSPYAARASRRQQEALIAFAGTPSEAVLYGLAWSIFDYAKHGSRRSDRLLPGWGMSLWSRWR
jgi:GTP cyclohydrolase II